MTETIVDRSSDLKTMQGQVHDMLVLIGDTYGMAAALKVLHDVTTCFEIADQIHDQDDKAIAHLRLVHDANKVKP